MPRNFPDWRRGDPIDAERLTRQHKARNQGIVGGRGIDVVRGHDGVVIQLKETRIIPSGGGGEGVAASGHREVVINGVFQTWAECGPDKDCGDAHGDDEANFSPHLGCNTVLANGDVDQNTYLKVFPNWGHTLEEFAPVEWDVSAVNQPTFSVFAGLRGWTMDFGQGELWVAPPTNLCSPDKPDPDAIGACCHPDEQCFDTNEGDCPAGVGEWKGAGTSCADDPSPCVECIGAGCEGTGACCCDETAPCWTGGHPITCWANQTQEDCEAEGGEYQGTNSVCGGQPGICGKPQISGACCLEGGNCIQAADTNACKQQGGAFQGFGTVCDPNPCPDLCLNPVPPIGACCNPIGGCLVETSEDCCFLIGGIWWGDGTVCADCP